MKKIDLNYISAEAGLVDINIKEDSLIKHNFILRHGSKSSYKLVFNHSIPFVRSYIHIKAVVYDSSYFDFEGLLKINNGATQVNTFLRIDCLLLSKKARARAVPSLEINEDDVKAGHGATIGYLNLDELFYLSSKGLSAKESENMLVNAFLNS